MDNTETVGMQLQRLTYSIPEAAKLLGISERHAFTSARRGDIPIIRIGHRMVVPKAALEAMLTGAATNTDSRLPAA